ncbi:hypothetical protein Hdeb2414_s0026g00682601 [Helianthus debilis subsp. tardiflorus]
MPRLHLYEADTWQCFFEDWIQVDEIQMEIDGAPPGGQPVPRGPRRRRPPPPDPLQGHPYLEFPDGTPASRHCKKHRRMHIGAHSAIDSDAIDEISEMPRVRRFIPVDLLWHRLFELAHTPSYRELLVEFLSSFTFHPRGAAQLPAQPDAPPLRLSYMHHMLATSIAGRGYSRGVVYEHRSFFFYCLLYRRPCILAHGLAKYYTSAHH